MAIGVWFSWVVLLIVSVLAILRILVVMGLLDRMPKLEDFFSTKTFEPSTPPPPPPPPPPPVVPDDDALKLKENKQSLNDEIHAKNIDKIQSAFSNISTKDYVKATIFVQLPSVLEYVTHIPSEAADKFADFCHHAVLALELISTEVDPITGCENITPKAYAYHSTAKDEVYTPVAKDDKTAKDGDKPPEVELAKYVAYIEIKPGFGKVGAVQVENEHRTEMHVIHIVLEHFPEMSQQTITCNSWVHPNRDNSENRVFFTNKSYLPSHTPSGLKRLRGYELEILRGDTKPKEKRLPHERIYDYDIYNDLGDPGNVRPSLGGSEKFPYPRRCRTGSLITRGGSIISLFRDNVYVPRDETFSELKLKEFGFRTLYTLLHHIIPPLEAKLIDDNKEYPFMTAINRLFNEEIKCPEMQQHGGVQDVVHRFIRDASDSAEKVFRFELPQTYERDAFSWFKDEEFARQTLAGMNPLSIKRLTHRTMTSIVDQNKFGKLKSGLTEELLDDELKRRYHISLKKAIEDKRLFIIDYHDAFTPYVERVTDIPGRYLYGSRTLFFYDEDHTLKPLAIELTRPPTKKNPDPYQEVFMPRNNATQGWLWKLAKAHVLAHDSSYHQLISHWLRAHCCTEPYIIAANRQLSAMHPIYRLLHPHFRYTMEINALARLALINADGIIEKTFSPGKYSLEISSAIYKSEWRFDREALPADLLHRGMAVEDSLAEHGVRLVIEDYPYANDGLDLWGYIKKWVTEYVTHYYKNSGLVESDQELQGWWTEVRTVGHGDKKEGWLPLNTTKDLIQIVSTIIWVTSGHHAAVNFGQYAYAGYFPNRPTITRTEMPTEYRYPNPEKPSEYLYTDRKKWDSFILSPEKTLLECFPSMQQAATVMAVLDVLSSHSSEEEYLGQNIEPSWEAEEAISKAFQEFQKNLEKLDVDITDRNNSEYLKHRYGAGVLPYELLRPKSEKPGVTAMGVPNSISI